MEYQLTKEDVKIVATCCYLIALFLLVVLGVCITYLKASNLASPDQVRSGK